MFSYESDRTKKGHTGDIEWAYRIKRDSFFSAFPNTYFRLIKQMSQEQCRMGHLYPPGSATKYHLRMEKVDVSTPFCPISFSRSGGGA